MAEIGVEGVERNRVGSVGRVAEDERRLRIDEAADQPGRRHAVDAGPRPRQPDLVLIVRGAIDGSGSWCHGCALSCVPFEARDEIGGAIASGRAEEVDASRLVEPLAQAPQPLHQLAAWVRRGRALGALERFRGVGGERFEVLTARGLKEVDDLALRRRIGRPRDEHRGLATAGGDLVLDPREVLACLGRVGQHVRGSLQRHGADALQPPPRLHARMRVPRRQGVEEQEPCFVADFGRYSHILLT